MEIKESIKRLSKSLEGEENKGVVTTTKAIIVGMTNFYFSLKNERAKRIYNDFCKDCEDNIVDHVEEMHVEDKVIPMLSKRMCGDCGCVLSFKVRQNIKPCRKWK